MKTQLLFFSLLLPFMIQAQLSQKVSKRFPAHIVYTIDDITSKVILSEDKQIKLGQKLVVADSLATISLAKGEPITQLKSYYAITTDFLSPILSAEELDNYSYAINKDNRFLVALKHISELKLSKNQVVEIRKQNENITSFSNLSTKETIQIYNTKLNTILDKEQYISLLKLVYKDQSISDAQIDWQKILALKLVSDENQKTEFDKIQNYHFEKNSFLDKKAERFEKAKRDFLAKKIALDEPSLLTHANILSNGVFINNKYSSIIQFEKELKLTKAQTDTLLSKYQALERIKLDNKDNELELNPLKTAPSEYENIAQILTTEQVNKWLVCKNKKEATKRGLTNWNQLETEGLAKDLDKNKTVIAFTDYQLNFLVTKERAMIYHTQENIFMKRDIEQKKPELLKQLDAIARRKSKNTTIKNALTW